MRAQTSATLTVVVALLFAGCSNSSDEGGSLPAPVNLSVTYYQWVRAYDGQRYGEWSSSISGILN